MPRKQRIEYPGAVYHIISRGNYRKELFRSENTGKAFERTIFEATERCGWKLHAYVIMSNHYHLAVETPEPNLVDGMKWLQSTFATRFNRLRKERGHVFQGRYKSILIGEDRSLLGLVDYIHLNPVRAGLCQVQSLKDYTLSSYPKYFKQKPREGLCRTDFLGILDLPDSLSGIRRYATHLELSEAQDPEKKEALTKRYCRGWFIGDKEAKKALAKDLNAKHPDVVWEGCELKELKQAQWGAVLVSELQRLKKGSSDISKDVKGAEWKVQIAKTLRATTTASNPWIAKQLNMGHPSRITNLIRKS
ncbi:transposase [Coraliomargarita parva]|uniref:transposase n=1 Tax=Coraliomargarita parva TaxID=3014050 RepID=UPI0022B4182A|nr:transposase [Coraliomargarita parva]